MAAARGARLAHFKLHGALANMASEDEAMARTCFAAALAVQPDLRLVVMPGTALQRAATALSAAQAAEIFADRTYNADGTLTDRSQPGAVVHDPDAAVRHVLGMLAAGGIVTPQGDVLPTRIDTICVHGDSAEALDIAAQLAAALRGQGYTIAAPRC
jgi:UPF0271 protein